MKPALRLHEAARAEVREAARWYEERREGLGTEFLDEVHRYLRWIVARELPGTATQARKGRDVRRVLLHRFPYAIHFEWRGTTCHVWAIAHTKRRPGYWRGRL